MSNTAVVRSAMTYGSALWHAPTGIKGDVTNKLAVVQNKCLRLVAGAYKATPIDVLHAETIVPPVREHLEMLQRLEFG